VEAEAAPPITSGAEPRDEPPSEATSGPTSGHAADAPADGAEAMPVQVPGLGEATAERTAGVGADADVTVPSGAPPNGAAATPDGPEEIEVFYVFRRVPRARGRGAPREAADDRKPRHGAKAGKGRSKPQGERGPKPQRSGSTSGCGRRGSSGRARSPPRWWGRERCG
jgi:hypothetical protein